MKSPSRRDSYSDSTDEEGEEDEEGFSPAGQNESAWEMDDTIHSAYVNASQSADRAEASRRSGTGFFQEISSWEPLGRLKQKLRKIMRKQNYT